MLGILSQCNGLCCLTPHLSHTSPTPLPHISHTSPTPLPGVLPHPSWPFTSCAHVPVGLCLSLVAIPHLSVGLDQAVALPRDSYLQTYFKYGSTGCCQGTVSLNLHTSILHTSIPFPTLATLDRPTSRAPTPSANLTCSHTIHPLPSVGI